MKKYFIWFIAMAILISELIVLTKPAIGFFFHIFLSTGLLIFSYKINLPQKLEKLVSLLIIFPIVRIASLFISISPAWNIALIYYLFLFLVLFYYLKFKEEVVFNNSSFFIIFLGILIGSSLGLFGNLLFDIKKTNYLIALLPVIILSEELYFHGLIQNIAEKNNNKFQAALFTSILYFASAIALGLNVALFLFFTFFVSSLVFSLTKNIISASLINLIITSFLFIIPKIV